MAKVIHIFFAYLFRRAEKCCFFARFIIIFRNSDSSNEESVRRPSSVIKVLKKNTSIPLDIHMMVDDPEKKLDWFCFGEGDYVSVHVESTKHLHRALSLIREKGAKPMVALNPATPISSVEEVFDYVDGILIMSVNPGFSGQKLVKSSLDKIKRLRTLLDEKGYTHVEIEVDGNVSFENAKLMKEAGANIFVAGTSSVFNINFSLAEGMNKLRGRIE